MGVYIDWTDESLRKGKHVNIRPPRVINQVENQRAVQQGKERKRGCVMAVDRESRAPWNRSFWYRNNGLANRRRPESLRWIWSLGEGGRAPLDTESIAKLLVGRQITNDFVGGRDDGPSNYDSQESPATRPQIHVRSLFCCSLSFPAACAVLAQTCDLSSCSKSTAFVLEGIIPLVTPLSCSAIISQ